MGYRSDEVASIVRDAITSHKLLPGDKLVEREIVESLGVSRVVARQALIRLSEEGLVKWQTNKGASVAFPELGEVVALFDALIMIERAIIEKAADYVHTEAWTDLREHADHELCLKHDHPVSAAVFHLKLAAMVQNQFISDFYDRLNKKAVLLAAIYGQAKSGRLLMHDHARMLDLIESGRIDEAKNLAERHQGEILRSYTLKEVREHTGSRSLGDVLRDAAPAHQEANPSDS